MKAKNFFICGLTGWCMEILFTSADCIRKKDRRMIGQTSLWMFPIYGMASCIDSIYPKIRKVPALIRGFFYSVGIFSFEYLSGSFLKKYASCPWDYSNAKTNINGLIRLDYAPLWAAAGLVFEHILIAANPSAKNTLS